MSQATEQTTEREARGATAPIIEAIDISREYELAGETVHAVRSVDLQIRPGEFITLVGRSGSGKTDQTALPSSTTTRIKASPSNITLTS